MTADPQTSVQHMLCPECTSSIPVDSGYVTWCDRCGWNLEPQDVGAPRSLIEALYIRIGRTFGRRLYEEVRKQPGRVSFTASRLLAFIIAACVHLITAVFVVAGVLLIVATWFHVLPTAAGLCLLALAWLLHPRLPRAPNNLVPRDRIPTWYRLADSVAGAIGATPVYGIVLTADFNASYSQAGVLRRMAILRLGVPLLSVLDAEGRAALLAHELAHSVNGDPLRGLVAGSAINTLATWYGLMRPARLFDQRLGGLAALGSLLSNAIMLALSVIPWTVAFILVHLMWRDSQRAEYRADQLATRVAGTEAMLRLLDALHLRRQVTSALQSLAVTRTGNDFFAELRRRVAMLPERERERIRRIEHMENSRLDATHPPTSSRIDLITACLATRAEVTVNASDARALDDELRAFEPGIQAALLDRYQRSLYY